MRSEAKRKQKLQEDLQKNQKLSLKEKKSLWAEFNSSKNIHQKCLEIGPPLNEISADGH